MKEIILVAVDDLANTEPQGCAYASEGLKSLLGSASIPDETGRSVLMDMASTHRYKERGGLDL